MLNIKFIDKKGTILSHPFASGEYLFTVTVRLTPESALSTVEQFRPYVLPDSYETIVKTLKEEIASYDTVIQGDQSCS